MFLQRPDTIAAASGRHTSGTAVPELADSPVPTQACCCPAKPMIKVVMPPAPGRPHPVDLWLCGHHYRESRRALAAAGARARDLSLPASEAGPACTIAADL